MKRFFVFGGGVSMVGLAVLAACVGDDPGSGSTSSSSTSSGGSSGATSSSGAGSSSGGSSGTPACKGDTVDACGTTCMKCTAPTGGTVDCVSGACQQKCAGTAAICGTACVDTQMANTDCGKCGHACNGSSCVSGLCQPVEVASGFTSVESIAASPTSMGVLMVVNGQDLKRCGAMTGGCNAQTLTDIATNINNMSFVATTGNDIYFEAAPSDPYIMYHCAVTGCPGGGPDQWDSENNVGVGALVAGPTHVYYTRSAYCSTYSRRVAIGAITSTDVRPKAGSCAYAYTDNTNNPSHETVVPSSVVSVGANTVLWNTGGLYNDSTKYLRSCALASTCTTPTEISTAPTYNVSALAYYNGNHYGASQAQIFSVADTVGATTRTNLVTDATLIVGIAVDASGIYWINTTTGNVKRCAKLAGCTSTEVETLATGQTGATQIALDTNNVYWSMPTKVMRVVK